MSIRVHPAASSSVGPSTSSVASGFEAQARVRLNALLIVLASLHAVFMAANLVGPRYWAWKTGCAMTGLGVHFLELVLTLTLLAVLKRDLLRPKTILQVALGYEVLTCFGVAYAEQAAPPSGLSFVSVLILLFPLFVPTSPRQTLAASLASAAVAPLAFVLHAKAGGIALDAEPARFVPLVVNFVFALMAVIPSKIVARMSRDLGRARRMGSYELVDTIGTGGMGEVWRARHRMLRRPAAIKLIRSQAFANENKDPRRLIERFEREAQATAALASPHTVELYDFGVAEDGSFYYVMELLSGVDLQTLVERFGPQPAERVIHILTQICDSLDDAHEAGLVHRDVKPANIFLCRKGRRHDFVKVLDFGLVKLENDDPDVRLTADDALQGTPAFLPPEAATGKSDVDARSDIYAVGCVAYWLLTGRLVFEAKTPMQMAVAHATELPVAPSAHAKDIPPWLDALILSCLSKDPADRPQSALVLAQRLEQGSMEAAWSSARATSWWNANLADVPVRQSLQGPATAFLHPAEMQA